VTFGAPFARGTLTDVQKLAVRSGTDAVPHQAWTTATWPDGSIKWAGIALSGNAGASEVPELHIEADASAAPSSPAGITVTESDDEITVNAGSLQAVIGRSGAAFLRSMSRDGVTVAQNGRLISSTVDTVDAEAATITRSRFQSEVTTASVESSGPLRVVVKVEGTHSGEGRNWLPFVIRLYFYANARAVKMIHSFVWDGDENTDFLASLGVVVDVPLREELYNRHVRIAGAEGGFLVEAVQGLTGLRRDPGQAVRDAQIAGQPTPPADTWNTEVSHRLDLIPTWPDFVLSQPTSDGFELRKRTGSAFPWVGISSGTRAAGFSYLGDTSGGFGISQRDFWQSTPVAQQISAADTATGTVTSWLYSPEARPMDLRFYHDGLGQDSYERQLEGLEITYEDYEEGFGTPYGVARTHELTLFAYTATPPTEQLADDARYGTRPALLQVDPADLHNAGVFGHWSLVDRSTPTQAVLEDKLDFLFDFYTSQVEQRRWYGFWNYGDVMHTYDVDRHVWRYDVGGYAWDNSELSPDLWLWYAYLRSGRGDVFRFAEAMTRHTGEVDVYHLGDWAGLGSRHNVLHWGCSAKQVRISNPAYRRFFYYLTADERTGDLLTELVDSDRNFLGLDPTRKVRPDVYQPNPDALAVGLGTDWGALAATWLTEWERTGSTRSRDRLLGTMEDIGALKHGFLTGEALYNISTGRFDTSRDRISVSHLSAVFGLVEITSELIALVDIPGFTDAWLQYCRLFLAPPAQQKAEVGTELAGVYLTQAHSRLTAYAAALTGDKQLAARAWVEYAAGGELLGNDRAFELHEVLPPLVLQPITEAHTVSTNDASQFALATIQLLALIGTNEMAESTADDSAGGPASS
jgi:hypothetical protein